MKTLHLLFPVIFMLLVGSNNSGALQIRQEQLTAIETLQRNAERGNPGAQVSLGTMYIQGTEVPQDYAEAQWKFSPMLLNGEPVPVIASVTVLFNLR
jgi:TPR repeat protein